jgi:hypothetical protein
MSMKSSAVLVFLRLAILGCFRYSRTWNQPF